MIDFTKSIEARQRQNSVWVDDVEYEIRTEFFHWVWFGRRIIKSPRYSDFDLLYKFTIPENRITGFNELLKFYRNEQPLPHDTGEKSCIIGMDWKIDSEYIRAAFLQHYRIDLLITDIHWHDFLALFNALKETMINDIISARYYKKSESKDPSKEYEEQMEKRRKAWALERQPTSQGLLKAAEAKSNNANIGT
jgi:hypothetical protein